MKRVVAAAIIVLAAFLLLKGSGGPTATMPDGTTVDLLIADTQEERRRGLMNTTLAEGQGMLFIFGDTAKRTFWMKNVPHSLDIIFLSEDFRIVGIFRDLDPCHNRRCPTYTSRQGARYALEVRGGFASEHGLETGDRIEVDLDRDG